MDTAALKFEYTLVALKDLSKLCPCLTPTFCLNVLPCVTGHSVESAGAGLLHGQLAKANSELAELAWSAAKLARQHQDLVTAAKAHETWLSPYFDTK